jgi:hypothetical protein
LRLIEVAAVGAVVMESAVQARATAKTASGRRVRIPDDTARRYVEQRTEAAPPFD